MDKKNHLRDDTLMLETYDSCKPRLVGRTHVCPITEDSCTNDKVNEKI